MHAAVQLMRWHSPVGALLLYAPCMWGLALAQSSWLWYLLFAVGAWFLRSFGCVINDIFDRNLDSDIPRTSKRPLACGKMPTHQAYLYALFCLCVGGCIWLYLPPLAERWSLGGLALALIYPLSKRFFFAPQLVLGVTFNIGIIVAYTAVAQSYTPAIWWVWASSVWWTIAYDTVYAFHDAPYDAKHGYFSTAHYAQKHPYGFVGACLAVHAALLTPILPLWICVFYGLGCGWLLSAWNPKTQTSAFRFFKWNLLLAFSLWLIFLYFFDVPFSL